MSLIDRVKAGIAEGRKEIAREQQIQKKIRKWEKEVDRRNPSAVGEAIGRTIQRVAPVTKPIRVAAVKTAHKTIKTAPKAIKAISSVAQSIAAPPPATIRQTSKGRKQIRREPAQQIGSPLDNMLLGAPVQTVEPKRSKKKRGKQREEVRRVHTLDDDLLFGGRGGGGGLLF